MSSNTLKALRRPSQGLHRMNDRWGILPFIISGVKWWIRGLLLILSLLETSRCCRDSRRIGSSIGRGSIQGWYEYNLTPPLKGFVIGSSVWVTISEILWWEATTKAHKTVLGEITCTFSLTVVDYLMQWTGCAADGITIILHSTLWAHNLRSAVDTSYAEL
jgi:hypothetical protein